MNWRHRYYCRQNRIDPLELDRRLRALDESQHWDAGRIEASQRSALRETLCWAAARVPYYRELFRTAGVRPEHVATLDGLATLPVLRRAALLEAGERLWAEGPRKRISFTQSSGTSGPPVRLAHDEWARYSMAAHRGRALSWYGVRLWDRHGLLVWQQMSAARLAACRISDWLASRRRNGSDRMDSPEAAATMRRFLSLQPAYVFGQPTFMHRLARFSVEAGPDPRRLGARVLLCNSEVLTPGVDEYLERTFECAVSNEYGCTEVGSMAHRCPAGTLHLNAEHVVVELVDEAGRPVPAGQPGEVLLTTLHNRTMPLVRYAVGDVAVRDSKPCQCGRQPDTVGLRCVLGRARDAWRDASGRFVDTSTFLAEAQDLLAGAGYWECQLAQLDAGRVELRVEPNRPVDAGLCRQIAERAAAPLCRPVEVVCLGRAVERSRGGKLAVLTRAAARI